MMGAEGRGPRVRVRAVSKVKQYPSVSG